MTNYAQEAFLHQIIGRALSVGASDIHLKVGQPPGARVAGDLVYFRVDRIRPEDTEAAARVLLGTHPDALRLETLEESVFAYRVPQVASFRVGLFRTRGSLAIVMRKIPLNVPTLNELGVPPAVTPLTLMNRGLVIVTGAAGQGKTTTLAGMINHLTMTAAKHVVTLEQPIEFSFEERRSSINQREVGIDVDSFALGLAALRFQDPDVVMISDIRQTDVLEGALEAAESGKLVLGALSAPDVERAVMKLFSLGREVPDFPTRLASALEGVVAQRLVNRRENNGLILACETFIPSTTARTALRNPDGAATIRRLTEGGGAATSGIVSFAAALERLASASLIAKQTT